MDLEPTHLHAPTESSSGVAVSQEEAFRDLLLARLASGTIELPVLSDVVQRVLVAASSETTDALTLSELIRQDQAITSHLFRVVNSALYSRGAAIVSLQQAVSRLGISMLRQMLLLVSCEVKAFQVKGREQEMRADFKLALVSGLVAQEIARSLRKNVEEAFLGGLLHDVGRPIVLQTLVDVSRESDIGLSRASEDLIVDELHATFGSTMMTRWRLSPALVEAVRFHHSPADAPKESTMAAVLHFSDLVARLALERPEALTEEQLRSHTVLSVLNFYPEDVDALLEKRKTLLEKATTTS